MRVGRSLKLYCHESIFFGQIHDIIEHTCITNTKYRCKIKANLKNHYKYDCFELQMKYCGAIVLFIYIYILKRQMAKMIT
jgi:hypothetical protein